MPFPVDERFIAETERKLGVTFPIAFRERMMRSNGGELDTTDDEWELYPFFDTSDRKRLARTCNDIVRETTKAREWDDFPSSAVAIAANGMGDYLVLMPEDNSTALSPVPLVWRHEIGEVEPADISLD